jgi:hypothetical protein
MNGTITKIDVSGAVNGTYPEAINSKDVIVGNYADKKLVNHGFKRKP